MITEFIVDNKVIHKNYGLPFFYKGMGIILKGEQYTVQFSAYNSDKNKQYVALSKLKN